MHATRLLSQNLHEAEHFLVGNHLLSPSVLHICDRFRVHQLVGDLNQKPLPLLKVDLNVSEVLLVLNLVGVGLGEQWVVHHLQLLFPLLVSQLVQAVNFFQVAEEVG